VPWKERAAILDRAADIVRERRYELAAWLIFEMGKNRVEALGEIEETADLYAYYAEEMRANGGYVREMGRLVPTDRNTSVLRPYGVWAVIAPWNFPYALLGAPAAAALVAGNTVVMKPSSETPLSGVKLVECYGLAYPEVAFRFVVDTRTRLDWPAVTVAADGPEARLEQRRERALAIWGARHAQQLVAAWGERDGLTVEALLGLPEHARATREGQVFLVNRRWIQSPLLSHAVRQAYGNLLAAGRFPACTVWLEVPAARLDVNVHPTKREVRFAEDDAVRSLTAGACARPLASLQPPYAVADTRGAESPWPDRVFDRPSLGESAAGELELGLPTLVDRAPLSTPEGGVAVAAQIVAIPRPDRPATPAPVTEHVDPDAPELWQLHRTYILASVRGGLVIVDQHAAHERILYEEAHERMSGRVGLSQQLLFPTLVDLSQSQFDLVLELGPWLKQLGWDLSPLGPPTVVVRGVPAELTAHAPGQVLQDILDGVSEATGKTGDQDIAEHLARTYACHAAVRAGDVLSRAEMRWLIDRLFSTTLPHGDPHGRPTFVRLDLDELNRRFGRS